MTEVAFQQDRLDFQLQDFTRIGWVNDGARSVWEPRIQQITQAWSEIEWLSVKSGVRRCALTVLTPEALVARAGDWALAGLNGLPLEIQGLANSYSSTGVTLQAGQPFGFRVVIGTPRDVAEFKLAFARADNIQIGQHLGFPECCQNFFEAVWVRQGMVDTTWPMAIGTAGAKEADRTLKIKGPPEANILWRWMGVRAVPHLPCSFACEASVDFGKTLIGVGREAGYDQEMDWIETILSWPVEWSALHGIAEIKTPVLRVSSRTDPTAHKFTVQRLSSVYPDETVQALKFPYRTPPKPILTSSSHHQRGLEQPIRELPARAAWYASDNGFTSIVAMDRAHQPIEDLASQALGEAGGSVLDLGCGNGALIKKLRKRVPQVTPFGIDSESTRIAHAKELLEDFNANFTCASMFDVAVAWPEEQKFDLVVLMPGRILEVGNDVAAALMARLQCNCEKILIYAYGDWLTRYGNLAGLARAAGLEPIDADTEASTCLARIANTKE